MKKTSPKIVKAKRPFGKTINHSISIRGIDFDTALREVKSKYGSFIIRNQQLTERHIDLANATSIQIISHFSLLATLSLTVAGFLVSQTGQDFTNPQRILIIFILGSQTSSLFFGALDYWNTIKFHESWAKRYQAVGIEVDKKVNNGKLQKINDMVKIEYKHIKNHKERTSPIITFLMVAFCIAGLCMLIVLFCAFFFDIPFWANS